eukprot:3409871-Rhodomonas_salina.2
MTHRQLSEWWNPQQQAFQRTARRLLPQGAASLKLSPSPFLSAPTVTTIGGGGARLLPRPTLEGVRGGLPGVPVLESIDGDAALSA